jgi:hypothetical protein
MGLRNAEARLDTLTARGTSLSGRIGDCPRHVASRRVLEKCGFRVVATERSFAEARPGEIEEFVLRLEESGSA